LAVLVVVVVLLESLIAMKQLRLLSN